ncbi:hypothetical protein ACIPSE_29160 [Streptomyces sp. NPDC090106]|uniref:hypothetical protein n=1 Tax=Streptomyces sp. NPDC090106 TaxID=3365946 RepID=UPI0037FA6F4E
MAGAGQDVRVGRGDDGTVRVGPVRGRSVAAGTGAGPDFTRAVLDVAGAVLSWPVLGEPGLPVAEIHDVGRAQQWLWAVYGERVAAEVAAPTGEPVGAEPSGLARAAGRLGYAHWAARWWPASFPDGIAVLRPGVLGLETAALTHRCQQLFDDLGDQPDDCAAELIEEHEAALDALVAWWRDPSQPTSLAARLDAVLRLVDDAADCAGLDGAAARRLRSALDAGRDRPAAADPGSLFASLAPQDGYALAAGGAPGAGGRVIARGAGVNDWRRCPPGYVDAAEHAVSWTVRAVGARRLVEVEVLAHGAAPAAGAALVAEVRVNGGGPLRVPLARRDDVWAGGADADLGPVASALAAPARVEVGVLLPGFDPGPGPDARDARDAVRALARHRLDRAARSVPDGDADDVSGPFLAETLCAATSEDY